MTIHCNMKLQEHFIHIANLYLKIPLSLHTYLGQVLNKHNTNGTGGTVKIPRVTSITDVACINCATCG